MLFNSGLFLAFFAVVMLLYRGLRDHRHQNLMLLIASYVFYGAWDWRFLSLIVASTLIDYHAARRIDRARRPGVRRAWLITSISFNLGMLGFFKYFDFAVESLAEILTWVGLHPHIPTLNLILPVGISFYTFQTISYTVDVYRRQRPAVDSLLDVAVYVAFFPQLVAGPIEKSTHLLPQFQRRRITTAEDFRVGLLWILLGYFKKVVIADSIAPLVDYAFAWPDQVSGAVSAVAVLAFAVQIYCDFAGYSLIARGLSRWMGFDLIQNFDAPYLARSPREFWSRWHISLSTWLRQYLYFSLGGNRLGPRRTYVNLMLVMLLGGLWHGARWNFVLWGAYHGLLLVICHAFTTSSKPQRSFDARQIVQIIVTFALTLVGWLLFRVTSMEHLVTITDNILFNFHLSRDLMGYLAPTVASFALLHAYHIWQEQARDPLVLLHADRRLRWGVYAFVAASLWVVGFQPTPFVYFQF